MKIATRLLARLLAEAAAEPDREVCGLLFGTAEAIIDAEPSANVAAEPSRAFEIDPQAMFNAIRTARNGGPSLIGHYHSHPTGRPVPSRCDAVAAAAQEKLWLILAKTEARLWRARTGGAVEGAFEEVALTIV